jgi:hypothetical protein
MLPLLVLSLAGFHVCYAIDSGPDDITNDRPAFPGQGPWSALCDWNGRLHLFESRGADLSLEQIQVTDVTATMFVLVDNRFAANANTQTVYRRMFRTVPVMYVHAGNLSTCGS